jgi:hypothetical protein
MGRVYAAVTAGYCGLMKVTILGRDMAAVGKLSEGSVRRS